MYSEFISRWNNPFTNHFLTSGTSEETPSGCQVSWLWRKHLYIDVSGFRHDFFFCGSPDLTSTLAFEKNATQHKKNMFHPQKYIQTNSPTHGLFFTSFPTHGRLETKNTERAFSRGPTTHRHDPLKVMFSETGRFHWWAAKKNNMNKSHGKKTKTAHYFEDEITPPTSKSIDQNLKFLIKIFHIFPPGFFPFPQNTFSDRVPERF